MESAKHEGIANIVDLMKVAGYNSPFDFMVEFLESTPPDHVKPLREWLNGDGMPSFIKTCTKHAEFRNSDGLNKFAIQLAKLQLTTEMQNLSKSPSLRQPLSEFSTEQICSFSLRQFDDELHGTAPKLLSLLDSLVLRGSNGIDGSLDLDLEEESDDEGSQPASIGSLPENIPLPRKSRSRPFAVQMAMSILLYARSQKINFIPGVLGYFLHSFRTPKRVIESLHRLGVCVSYDSVISSMKAVARDCEEELWKLAADFPPLFAYLDNMNYYARVRDQRLDNRAEMQNDTIGYIGLNPHPAGQHMLLRESTEGPLETLCADHLLPTERNLTIYRQHVWAGISAVLHMYCDPHLRQLGVPPCTYMEIYKLSAEPTKIFTLPAYDKNEAVIDEMTEVLRLVMQALGYTREKLVGRTIFFCGDYLTIRNIRFVHFRRLADSARIAIDRQGESIPRDHLDHFEPVAGMFHLQMAVLNLLFRVHIGDQSDLSSLAKWFVTLRRDSNIFGTGKRRTIKDFRACDQLFNHILDGHVLAIVATKLGVSSCKELCKALETRKWREAFGRMEEQLTDSQLYRQASCFSPTRRCLRKCDAIPSAWAYLS